MKKKYIVEYYGGCTHFDDWEQAGAFIKKQLKYGPVSVSYE
jgi:hypothetical protein